MKTKKVMNSVAAGMGAVVMMSGLSVLSVSAQATENPFMSQFVAGSLQLVMEEGKCGADKAGEAKCGAEKSAEGKCGEAKCGADKAAKAVEGKCGAEKAVEGKCGAEKAEGKMKEGKCGEAKCGANNKPAAK